MNWLLWKKKKSRFAHNFRLQNDIKSVENEILAKEEEIVSGDKQLAESAESIETEQAALKKLYGGFEAQEASLTKKKAGQSNEDERLKTKENEIRETKKKLDDLRQKINDMEIQCREVVLNADNLTRAIREKYDVDWESMFSAFTKVDEEKVAELSSVLEKDKQAINSFGEVNLLALNEYEELDKRYQFLSTRISDLILP